MTDQAQQQQNSGGGQQQQQKQAAWYGELPADTGPEFKDWLGTKGFKDPLSALQSFHNAEKLIGAPADQVIRLPKADDADGWSKVWGRLGRPEKADGYELPLPEGDDGTFAKTAAGWFHAAGVPKTSAQAVVKAWNTHVAGAVKAQADSEANVAKQALDALKTEWGIDFDKHTETAKRGIKGYAESAGLKTEVVKQLEGLVEQQAWARKLFAKVGETMAESKFAGGEGPGTTGLTPAVAKQQLDEARQMRIDGKMGQKEFQEISDRLAPLAAKER